MPRSPESPRFWRRERDARARVRGGAEPDQYPAAGADRNNVAKMIFYVKDLATRDLLNAPWAERFPDPASRPARHTQLAPLADKVLVACDFLAYVES